MSDNEDIPATSSGMTEEDLSLPKVFESQLMTGWMVEGTHVRFILACLPWQATMSKMIIDLLPPGITVAKETKDLLSDACVEFIHLIASEANEIAEKDKKKTISGEYVVAALKNLGFEEYVDDMMEILSGHATSLKVKKSKLKESALSQDELLKLQEEMFSKSRLAMESKSGGM